MHEAVFFDRDATINAVIPAPDHRRVDSPAALEEFGLLPGAVEAIRAINDAGLEVIPRGRQTHGRLS